MKRERSISHGYAEQTRTGQDQVEEKIKKLQELYADAPKWAESR